MLRGLALLLALIALANAMRCVSSNAEYLKLCEEVAPKVEALWGKVRAVVVLVPDSKSFTVGEPRSGSYVVHLSSPDPCTLAHELTHAIELERGLYEPRWFAEGLAELSCYLLYPGLYARRGYAGWVGKGYGDYDPYFFGLTVVYYWYAKGGDVWSLANKDFAFAAKLFAEALESGVTPYSAVPHPPPFGYVELDRGWAYGGRPEGQYWKFGEVEVFYGKGKVAWGSVPFILPPLPPRWLKRCGSSARRLRKRAARS